MLLNDFNRLELPLSDILYRYFIGIIRKIKNIRSYSDDFIQQYMSNPTKKQRRLGIEINVIDGYVFPLGWIARKSWQM